jgi:uncharacterized phage protein (TIGR02220 family)
MEERWYTIPTWREYQHYADRSPPWIKLHYDMLSSRSWVMLADASRVLMVSCMLIASRNDGRVPDDIEFLKRVAYINGKVDLKPLIDIGFLVPNFNVLADASGCKQKQANAPQSLMQSSEEIGIRANVISSQNADAKSVIDHFNAATGRSGKAAVRPCKANLSHINARLNEFTVDDLKLVIDFKVSEWKNDPKMHKYLRITTLFGTDKSADYVSDAHQWAASRKPSRPEPTGIQRLVLSPEEDEARRIVHEERCADREAFSAKERPYNAIHGPGAYARMRIDAVKAAMKQGG